MYVEEWDPAAVGRAHQLVPVPRVPLPVGGLERGEERRRLRRRRERQHLLPEHEVLPHPALDDVAEPAADGEAQRVPAGAPASVEDGQLAAGAHGRHGLARSTDVRLTRWSETSNSSCLPYLQKKFLCPQLAGPRESPARAGLFSDLAHKSP